MAAMASPMVAEAPWDADSSWYARRPMGALAPPLRVPAPPPSAEDLEVPPPSPSGRGRAGHHGIALAAAVGSFALSMASFARYPTEWDSVSLRMGLDRFDVLEASPHSPGYYLYVLAGRFLRTVTPLSGTVSLQVVAALAAAACVGVTHLVGVRLGSRWLGLTAAGVLATSPLLRFYGATIDTYTFDALLSVLLILLALSARPGSRHAVVAAGVLSLGSGSRQTSLLLLGPLVLLAAWRSVRSVRRGVEVVAAGVVGLLAWAVPMFIEQPGGWSAYWPYSQRFTKPAFLQTSILYGAPASGVRHNFFQVAVYTTTSTLAVLPVTALAVAVLAYQAAKGRSRARTEGPRRPGIGAAALSVALFVPLAFVTILHFGKAGYALSYLPAAVLILLWPASRLRGAGRIACSVLVLLGCTIQTQRFFQGRGIIPVGVQQRAPGFWLFDRANGAPYGLTAAEIRGTDRQTDAYLAIADHFDPRTDVLVYVFLNGGQRFRHATFFLSAFRIHFTADRLDHFLAQDKRLWSERDTDIELPPGGRVVYVLDLPNDEITAQMEAGTLSQVVLPTGPSVWVGGPGVTVAGVTAVVTPDHPLAEHLP